MIDSVTSKEREGYLLIESSGIVENIAEWKELDRLQSEIMLKSEFNKVIVDDRNIIYKNEIYMIIETVSNMIDNLPFEMRFIKIAVVVKKESRKIADFWETYSVNRGYNCRAFTNFDKAIAFINE